MNIEPVELLAQADLLQVAAALFALPDERLRERLRCDEHALREMVTVSGLAGETLERALQETLRLAQAADMSEWTAEATRLFECSVLCPINETAYVRRDKGAILADVAAFYRAFGLGLEPELGEKLDHLRCELEFVALLLVLWARAEQEGEAEGAEVTRQALESFSGDHLGVWLPGFTLRLAETTGLQLYANAGAFLEELWRSLCDRLQLPAGRGKVLVSVEEDAGTPYECGMSEQGTC